MIFLKGLIRTLLICILSFVIAIKKKKQNKKLSSIMYFIVSLFMLIMSISYLIKMI